MYFKDDKWFESDVLIEAWHGTSCESAEKIVRNGKWKISEPEEEWLGRGVYFVEGSKSWACIWAKKGKHRYKRPCAIRCFLKAKRKEIIDLTHDYWYKVFQIFRKKLPLSKENKPNDGKVIDLMCKYYFDREQIKIKLVRAIYVPGEKSIPKIAPWSHFAKSQVQICVKDVKIIEIDRVEKCGGELE